MFTFLLSLAQTPNFYIILKQISTIKVLNVFVFFQKNQNSGKNRKNHMHADTDQGNFGSLAEFKSFSTIKMFFIHEIMKVFYNLQFYILYPLQD